VGAGVIIPLLVGGAAVNFMAANERANAAQTSADMASQQLRDQANAREVERSRKLRAVLAHNTALAGARGVALSSGSLAAIGMKSADNFRLENDADNVAVSDRIRGLQYQADVQGSEAFSGAVSNTLGSFLTFGENYKKGLLD
jgi:hypothetical protein